MPEERATPEDFATDDRGQVRESVHLGSVGKDFLLKRDDPGRPGLT